MSRQNITARVYTNLYIILRDVANYDAALLQQEYSIQTLCIDYNFWFYFEVARIRQNITSAAVHAVHDCNT